MTMNNIKMTQYSHGAGCGCKIAPKVLTTILESQSAPLSDVRLLVGNDSRDDAAVYDLGNGEAIISTTDFFMPIVDDPYTFGRIAAVNAISDVYAMGGTPLLAIAILGWPIDKLAPEVARQVLEGGRAACKEAGIVLAGGHSIDNPEPIFGLAVTGRVSIDQLKRNDGAVAGCRLYLTKPLGVGILTTAQKKGLLKSEHEHIAPESMTQLNKMGQELAAIAGVKALTDVTGFGLLGHLSEMCEGSGVSAELWASKVPRFDAVAEYLALNCVPGGTHRNWDSYGHLVEMEDEADRLLFCDAQTSGGLLIAVEEAAVPEVETLLGQHGFSTEPIGVLVEGRSPLIRVRS